MLFQNYIFKNYIKKKIKFNESCNYHEAQQAKLSSTVTTNTSNEAADSGSGGTAVAALNENNIAPMQIS